MPAHYEYTYTTGTLPATPRKSIEYHYNDSSWSDVLTGISEVTYTNSNTSTASAYSLNGATNESSETDTIEFDSLAQSLLGNNYKKVDLFSTSLVKGRGTVEDGGGILTPESNISTYSTNSVTTNSTTLYTFQSDEIGNITNVSGVVDLEWNGRRLESISQNGTEILSYDYNIDGQRTKKIVTDPTTGTTTTTEFFYNGSILAGQKTGDNVLIFMYDNNGDVFGFTYNGTPYYYVKNAQNDVFLILDETGEPVVIYQYDAWGKFGCYDATEENIASVNPITYRSYYVDLEMGFYMYYLNSRYYMADWCRFISADGVVSEVGGNVLGNNLFAYCQNNPVNLSDETGNWPKWIASVSKTISNAVKKAVNTVVNVVKSFSSSSRRASMVIASINSLPRTGDPNSSQTLPNPDGTPKQKRWYGPDGSAVRDRDYNHTGDDVTFPHDHEWKDGERGKEHLDPDPEYEFTTEQIIGVGVVLVCAVGIAYVVANDLTGIGVVDDFLIAPLGAGASTGLTLVFGYS